MTGNRRNVIQGIIEDLQNLKDSIEECKDEEQNAFDGMSPNEQEDEYGEKMLNTIACLEGAISNIEEAMDDLMCRPIGREIDYL